MPQPRIVGPAFRVVLGLCALVSWTAPSGSARAGAGGSLPAATAPPVRIAQISGDPARPRRHFRLRFPAILDPPRARAAYAELVDRMVAGYRLSRHPVALSYRGWRRYNRAPYRSATHGNRYVNNYANPRARAYGRFEKAGRLPVGAIIAKDSFTVTRDGEMYPGPLFVMEKMAKGFKYVTGDWRYTMIMPDGSIFGVTNGVNSDKVEFCIACHLARERYDHLYFIPRAYRIGSAGD